MPSPIDILLDPISLIVLTLYAGLILWEAAAPGRDLPSVPHWKLRGLTSFWVFFYLSSYLPLLWDEHLAQYQLLDLTILGTTGGFIAGLLVYETGVWTWHRSMHKSKFLWRVCHQMHHSAERLDCYGAFYFSITDMIGWTFLGSFCLVLVIGIEPKAATILLLSVTFMGMFQHANIRTPRWLGYIIQRPESHTIHHGRGVHAFNYADLPLIDMLFGTFRNPTDYTLRTGFYLGGSKRVLDMLLFRDVSTPQAKERTAGGARWDSA